jgi:hypothetical protein
MPESIRQSRRLLSVSKKSSHDEVTDARVNWAAKKIIVGRRPRREIKRTQGEVMGCQNEKRSNGKEVMQSIVR